MIESVAKAYEKIKIESGEAEALSKIDSFFKKYSLSGMWKPLLSKIEVIENKKQLESLCFVTTSIKLNDKEKENLVKEFELNSIEDIREVVDESLVSGLIVRYNGKQYVRAGKNLLEQFKS